MPANKFSNREMARFGLTLLPKAETIIGRNVF
jgi:hypothetical protein